MAMAKSSPTTPSHLFPCTLYFQLCEAACLLLPGRVPGYSRSDIQLLPSSDTKRAIWRSYITVAEADATIRPVAYTTFCHLWKKLMPSIVIMKPRSDLCWQCQQNSTAIIRTANLSEADKTAAIGSALEHLHVVKMERTHYKTICDECKVSVRAHFSADEIFIHTTTTLHTYTQQHQGHQGTLFSDPLQPGPIYFLTPWKCTVFGVACEALPRQINFLTDEAGDCGKGADALVSCIHYFFDHHGFGKRNVYLHADNCTRQNKNNCMVQYLVRRTLTNRHTNITLSFLPVGHTKFAPDWCFGLFKRAYRQTKVGSLAAIADVVNKSAECNFAQLVFMQNGTTVVPTHDWPDVFATQMKKIVGIKTPPLQDIFLIFWQSVREEAQRFSWSCIRYAEGTLDTRWRRITHCYSATWTNSWSTVVLYDSIRPFWPDDDKDTTCPLPSVPKLLASREALQTLISTHLLQYLRDTNGHVAFAMKKVTTNDHAQTNNLLSVLTFSYSHCLTFKCNVL